MRGYDRVRLDGKGTRDAARTTYYQRNSNVQFAGKQAAQVGDDEGRHQPQHQHQHPTFEPPPTAPYNLAQPLSLEFRLSRC